VRARQSASAPRGRTPRRISSRREDGQSLVEFALIVPIFLLLLLSMLEFGFAFEHDQTLAYATREGARAGATAGDGSTSYPCNATTKTDFDAPVIAAVERVLTSPGSPIDLSQVSAITVYLAKPDGTPNGTSTNVWTPATGAGPTVDGKALDFKQTTLGWPCTARSVGGNPASVDALGVSISYRYQFRTSFGGIVRFIFGNSWSSMAMSDRTVMNLNPTN
jgi:Flp pilus assembly protein TadG